MAITNHLGIARELGRVIPDDSQDKMKKYGTLSRRELDIWKKAMAKAALMHKNIETVEYSMFMRCALLDGKALMYLDRRKYTIGMMPVDYDSLGTTTGFINPEGYYLLPVKDNKVGFVDNIHWKEILPAKYEYVRLLNKLMIYYYLGNHSYYYQMLFESEPMLTVNSELSLSQIKVKITGVPNALYMLITHSPLKITIIDTETGHIIEKTYQSELKTTKRTRIDTMDSHKMVYRVSYLRNIADPEDCVECYIEFSLFEILKENGYKFD